MYITINLFFYLPQKTRNKILHKDHWMAFTKLLFAILLKHMTYEILFLAVKVLESFKPKLTSINKATSLKILELIKWKILNKTLCKL